MTNAMSLHNILFLIYKYFVMNSRSSPYRCIDPLEFSTKKAEKQDIRHIFHLSNQTGITIAKYHSYVAFFFVFITVIVKFLLN